VKLINDAVHAYLAFRLIIAFDHRRRHWDKLVLKILIGGVRVFQYSNVVIYITKISMEPPQSRQVGGASDH
jgi:hypothetical protein